MSNVTTRRNINVLGYIAVVLIATSLVLKTILGAVMPESAQTISSIIKSVAFLISTIITLFVGFMFAKSKRNVIFMVIYLICAVAIICFYFIW